MEAVKEITVYSQRRELVNTLSDLHKDVYGHRPRNPDYLFMTAPQLIAEIDRLIDLM